MTLRDKFQKWHDSPTNETVAENIIELEQIADEHATEFATWVVRRMLEDPTIELKDDTLGKFKTEKGL